MSTSLAEQLRRLAVPQTSVFGRTDKKRPSLLFDPKEAANINCETFYQIGLEGLEELKTKSPVFAKFENSLFHVTSKNFERSVQTEDANRQLNKKIKRFLVLLSPYFMLNGTYKALEWLIYQYSIHEYSKEDILMLILPYHETNIFVRMLQLLDLKDSNDRWNWLMPLQKPGIHLAKTTLYNHAASNSYFIKFISNFINSLVKEHENHNFLSVLFNFYCVTLTGALEYSNVVKETHVTNMLPGLLAGLSSEIPDYCAAVYVIAAKLFTKTTLTAKILLKLGEKIAKFPIKVLYTEGTMLLVILYQAQSHFRDISRMALQQLSNKADWLPKKIEELQKNGVFVTPLLEVLLGESIKGAVANNDESLQAFVISLIQAVRYDDKFIGKIIRMFLYAYRSKFEHTGGVENWSKEVIHKLEVQYPTAFDQEVASIMKIPVNGKFTKDQKSMRKLIQKSLRVHGTSIFEKLYHPSPQIRLEAVKYMLKHFNESNDREKELLKNIVIQNLNNDDPDIVMKTLKDSKELLPSILERTELNCELYKILNKYQSGKETWWAVLQPALQIFCNNYQEGEATLLLHIFPFLLPSTHKELKVTKIILNSACRENSKLLKFLYGYCDTLNSYGAFCAKVFEGLKSPEIMPDIRSLLRAFKEIPEEFENTLHKYVAALLLSSTLPENCPAEVTCLFLDILISYSQTTKLKPCKLEPTVSNCINLASNDKFPLQSFLECVEKLISKTEHPKISLEKMDLSTEEEINKFYVTLMNMLLKGCFYNKRIVAELYFRSVDAFLEHFARNFNGKISVLLNASTTNSKYNEANFQMNCLEGVFKYLNEHEDDGTVIKLDSLTVPYLLVLLGSSNTKIRGKALEILDRLALNTEKKQTYLELIEQVVEYKEEIGLDGQQIAVVMSNIYRENSIFKKLLLILREDYPVCLKAGLLNVLSKINGLNIFETTAELARKVLEAFRKDFSGDLSLQYSEIIYFNCLRFTEEVACDVKLQSNVWRFLEASIKNETSSMTVGGAKKSPACFVLEQIDIDLFSNLQVSVQSALLMLIVDVATFSPSPDAIAAANHVVKRIDLDAELISAALKKMCEVKSAQITTRKRRASTIPTVDILDMDDWKRGVAVLEIIQNKKKMRNIHAILPSLFEILKRCLDFEEQTNVEYPKQLVLSSILHCCTKLQEGEISENVFNMELVVQCIRASQNPQVHHHALVLLAHAATLLPKQVLHHIMAIFTFMGSSVLRHDDAYSFQIITKIIDTIIPILVEDASEENVSNVLRVFVDVVLDVPEHRRMPIYTQLLNKIDQKENLYLFLLLMFEAHVLHPQSQNTNKDLLDIVPKRLGIAANLCRTFKPNIVIQTCLKLVQYLRGLPDDKDERATGGNIAIFDVKRRSPKQFRHYKYVLLNFISNLLTSPEFVNQVAELNDDETYAMEPLYKDMIINILTYIQSISKVTEKKSNTNQAQYWKVLLHHSYDILDSLNALLTPQMFLLVIRGLMVHNLTAIKKRAMELLNNRLQHNAAFFEECEDNELYAMLPPLIQIIKLVEHEEGSETENELVIQTALLSLKLLVRLLSPKNPEKFVDILDFITCLLKGTEGNILASVILCLADFCYSLRSHSIKSLGPFVHTLVKVIKRQKHHELPNLLLLSAVAALNKILDSLPLFLSPYLEKLLCEVSSLASRIDLSSTDSKMQPIVTKIQNVKQKLGASIPLRVLIPNIDLAYAGLVSKKDYKSVGPLMDVLTKNLSRLSSSEIQGFLPDLTAFFLKALDFRSEVGTENDVETHVIKALAALVLKLSESSFRPLYYKLFHWATSGHGPKERVVTFYCLSNSVANCLKGLFVLFAQHILQNAATLLAALNTVEKSDLDYSEEESLLLLENILETLSAVFLYDSQRFVNKERFDLLMQPLVDQLENDLGGDEHLESRTKTLVIPCLVNFAVATADDALWKQLNYQILLKMRHDSSLIRLLALECLTQIAKKLGDDFLPLLPETIPFLAELLEDNNEKVEKACQKSIQELEKVLGEPLQKYF